MASITENLDAAATRLRASKAETITFQIRDEVTGYSPRPALQAHLHRTGFAEIIDEQAGPLTGTENAELQSWRAAHPDGIA